MTLITFEKLRELYKLKSVVRYNNRQKIKDESVAEHSFFVSAIALQVCDDLNLSDKVKLDVLTKCILHDMPEIYINDITYDVKQRLQINDILKHHEDMYFESYYKKHYKLMQDDDMTNIVNVVVKFADAISVLQYVMNEKDLGNRSIDMHSIFTETLDRIKKLEETLITLSKEGE